MLKKLKLDNHKLFLITLIIVLIKFLFARTLLFEQPSALHTIVVEIGYLLLIFGLIELLPFNKLKTILYITLNVILSFILFTILVYDNYFGYIVTIHAFSLIGQIGDVKDSVIQLIKPIYLLLFVDFVFFIIYGLFRRKGTTTSSKKINFAFVIPVLILGLSIVSYQIIKEKDNDIANTVIAAEKQGIITYEILAAKNNLSIDSDNVLTEEEIAELPDKILEIKQLTPLPKEELKYNGVAKDKNIIVIQAEAFQDFAINLEIDGQEVTPFLNELLSESIYFSNTIQQNGPGNTSDAEFTFNTSLYPPAWEPTSEIFGDRAIPSFPKQLSQEGYESLTFHPNDIDFWNRKDLYPALGFDHYYDDTFFKNEDIIGMGSSDELVYEKSFPELKERFERDQKFYAQFVTLTSHHPFKIPADKNTLHLPSRFEDTLVNDYLESLAYTDWALEQFVNELKEANMWEDTMLVFYGDHMGMQKSALNENELDLLAEIYDREYTHLDQFYVPFIVTLPGENINEEFKNIGGHLDYMPTIANLLDLSLENQVHFGQDIINYPDNLLGMRYYMPPGSFFNNEIAFKPEECFDDGEAFSLDTLEKIEDFSAHKEDYDRILHLLNLSDKYMNSLPKR